jgi:hypothetical protein
VNCDFFIDQGKAKAPQQILLTQTTKKKDMYSAKAKNRG